MEIRLNDELARIVDSNIQRADARLTELARGLLVMALQAQLDERPRYMEEVSGKRIIEAAERLGDSLVQNSRLRSKISRGSPIGFNLMLHALHGVGRYAFPKDPND